jgi:hypothetical protein
MILEFIAQTMVNLGHDFEVDGIICGACSVSHHAASAGMETVP